MDWFLSRRYNRYQDPKVGRTGAFFWRYSDPAWSQEERLRVLEKLTSTLH